MIVVRALVLFGVAQLDGRLMPGQRLVSVNDITLDDELTIKSQLSNEEFDILKVTKGINKGKRLFYKRFLISQCQSFPSVKFRIIVEAYNNDLFSHLKFCVLMHSILSQGMMIVDFFTALIYVY